MLDFIHFFYHALLDAWFDAMCVSSFVKSYFKTTKIK